MVRIFDMTANVLQDETFERAAQAHTPSLLDVQDHRPECQLRLLTVAEAEEQQRIPRPRPWLG